SQRARYHSVLTDSQHSRIFYQTILATVATACIASSCLGTVGLALVEGEQFVVGGQVIEQVLDRSEGQLLAIRYLTHNQWAQPSQRLAQSFQCWLLESLHVHLQQIHASNALHQEVIVTAHQFQLADTDI